MDTTSLEPRDRSRQAIIGEVIDLLEASIRALKSRHNELAPISRLPSEVLATIFSFLSIFAWNEGSSVLAWTYVARVCCRWRETTLNHPRLWSHINLTKLTPVGIVEIFSRTKTAPLNLNLEVTFYKWNMEHYEALARQLEAHISHTRHLKLSGYCLSIVIKRLVLPTPILESISLSHYGTSNLTIPDNLFNCTAPSLTSLKLNKCDISWKSPLLKRLRILEILELSSNARPELNDWLDALNEMSQLKDFSLRSATPVAPLLDPPMSRTVTLPSLTYFHIKASAKDCALALAHLVLPTLARLHVDVESHYREGEDVLRMIPYVVRKVCVLQDIEPIRSILVDGDRWLGYSEVLAWTTPGADVKFCGPTILDDMSSSACFLFTAKSAPWNYGVDDTIFDALLTLFPTNFVSTLTTQHDTRLSKEFWIGNAPRLPLLEQACLCHASIRAFLEMLAEDTPPDGPRLPSLTRLILFNVTVIRSYHLVNMLIKRVEQGIPLECIDFYTYVTTKLTIQSLAEIMVEIQEPLCAPLSENEVFNWYEGICYGNEVEFDDRQGP
ncbi:hypothetical protein BGY98DRAFT_1094968 [Russula aff. rugulosa BPL654]|nr:hypothetical protein BGY98DRAFT_1094968 [Russula aff. rugulosa BPL654]